ncbi:MAG: hypothetical protein KGV59_01350 [Tenacibaculum sp.]|nr:hypothetical protein [Tenacibaculum sp.]
MEINNWIFTKQEQNNIEERLKNLRELFLLHKSDFNLTSVKEFPFSKLAKETKNNIFLEEHYNAFKKKNLYLMDIRSYFEIYNNREKGELVCINKKYLRDNSHIYTQHKYLTQNTDNINLYKDLLEKYCFIDYLEDLFEKYISDETSVVLRQINNTKNPRSYIDTVVSNICNTLLNLNNLKKKSEEYDEKNYILIIEKMTIALKNLTYSYFEYLDQATKNKIKTINRHFISFFKTKTLEKSFESSLPNDYSKSLKLSSIRKNLINKGCIKEINNPYFVKIFDNTHEVIQRVNWIESKGLLFYFINKLIEKEIIINPKDKWKKVSMCFLWNGKYIDYIKMKHTPSSKNRIKNKMIDNIIEKLT